MLKVGLTGGIGAGKSEVSRLLVSYGAVLIDSDLISREVVEPGTPGLAAVVEEFGPGVLTAEGTLTARRSVRSSSPTTSCGPPSTRSSTPWWAPARPNWNGRLLQDAVVVHDVPSSPRTGSPPSTTWSWSSTPPPRPSSTGS